MVEISPCYDSRISDVKIIIKLFVLFFHHDELSGKLDIQAHSIANKSLKEYFTKSSCVLLFIFFLFAKI